MDKTQQHIIKQAKSFVMKLFERELSGNLLFHSKYHTLNVLENVKTIGLFEKLDENDIFLLKLGALFHDTGYTQCYAGHEEASVEIAMDFLEKYNVSKTSVDIITGSIKATKMPQSPVNIYDKVLCDADLHYLATETYFEESELLRNEWRLCGIVSMSETEFLKNSAKFLKLHQYHTSYGKKNLVSKKTKTLEIIRAKIAKTE